MKSVAIISTPFFSASISSGIAGSDIELHLSQDGGRERQKDTYGEQWMRHGPSYMAVGKKEKSSTKRELSDE
jgi:hypothetical protein